MIQVDTGRLDDHRRDLYTPQWERLGMSWEYPAPDHPTPEPLNLSTMIEMAETLGADTDFVRVDLYDIGERVVFGELTHAPAGEKVAPNPASFDLWLGQQWSQPRRYV